MVKGGFALSGMTLPGDGDPFGIWETPGEEAVSFDVDAPTEPTWRVHLPPAPEDALALLKEKRSALRHGQSHLVKAQERLARLDAGVSYDAPTGPEAALLRTLQAIEAPASFGPRWHEDAEQREVFQRWRDFLGQIRKMVAHYAHVETDLGGSLIGRTTVGWTGDFETHWSETIDPQSMAMHQQALQLALESRLALLRLLSVVSTGAAKLALRLTVPGAQLLVLPAAWTFVRDVLRELRGRG